VTSRLFDELVGNSPLGRAVPWVLIDKSGVLPKKMCDVNLNIGTGAANIEAGTGRGATEDVGYSSRWCLKLLLAIT